MYCVPTLPKLNVCRPSVRPSVRLIFSKDFTTKSRLWDNCSVFGTNILAALLSCLKYPVYGTLFLKFTYYGCVDYYDPKFWFE